MALALGVGRPGDPLSMVELVRRTLTPYDVRVQIFYSGICHSDKHHIYNDWGDSKYPMVPGHEIVGVVDEIGENVTQFRPGDRVAIGNMTDSCQHCLNCQKGQESYCLNGGPTWVYNGNERVNETGGRYLRPEGAPTYGGYSTSIVAQEKFVFHLPNNLDPARSTPLLCAGITMYAPLKHHKIGKGSKIGIAGIGGLGHLGVKIASALGAEIIGLTTTPDKLNDLILLGATDGVLMTDPNQRETYHEKLDLIIDTIPVPHDLKMYLDLLHPGGSSLHMVGNMNDNQVKGQDFIFKGKSITGSNVGGIVETREMLDFCSQHEIMANIDKILPGEINSAIRKMVNKEARYRYVIDWSSFWIPS